MSVVDMIARTMQSYGIRETRITEMPWDHYPVYVRGVQWHVFYRPDQGKQDGGIVKTFGTKWEAEHHRDQRNAQAILDVLKETGLRIVLAEASASVVKAAEDAEAGRRDAEHVLRHTRDDGPPWVSKYVPIYKAMVLAAASETITTPSQIMADMSGLKGGNQP